MPIKKNIYYRRRQTSDQSSYNSQRKIKRKTVIKNLLGNRNSPQDTLKKISQLKYPKSYVSNGLSPKEKNFILSAVQPKSRLEKLKAIAQDAVCKNKIFSMYGYATAVQKALLERGWIEKIPPERMNLSKIKNGVTQLEKLLLSHLIRFYEPNLIWFVKDSAKINLCQLSDSILVNRLILNASWTSKHGLSSSLENQHWFNIPDVSEVVYPRTFHLFNNEQYNDFVFDYRLTACTNLLKWVLAMVANKKQITSPTGSLPIALIVFSLNRCKEYLDIKHNKDIDKTIGCVSDKQWDTFLNKYYRVIGKIDLFESDKSEKLPLYLIYAKFLLKEMHKHRPQLNCEGCHNVWIFKPSHSSRGRGIRLASKLGVITKLMSETNNKYIIQKYIEEPLLIYETKFDIRQYYLVTSSYPLEIWMYKDCYLKYSSQRYNLKSYHESIHLTNNAIQKHYTSSPDRHPNLPIYNMWTSEKFQSYLSDIGMKTAWKDIIYPGMKKSIIGVMLSSQDSMSVSRNRFELYGCDFILDKSFKPWLIEINSRPDLSSSTPVTATICPDVLADVIKVVLDYPNNHSASTGKFTCIYRQYLSKIMPHLNGRDTNLSVQGYGLSRDYFHTAYTAKYEKCDEIKCEGGDHDFKKILYKLKQAYAANEQKHRANAKFEICKFDESYLNDKKSQNFSQSAFTNSSFTFKT